MKLYDFAVYLNRASIRSRVAPKFLKEGLNRKAWRNVMEDACYYDHIVRDEETELSVIMIPSRKIPLGLITSEVNTNNPIQSSPIRMNNPSRRRSITDEAISMQFNSTQSKPKYDKILRRRVVKVSHSDDKN